MRLPSRCVFDGLRLIAHERRLSSVAALLLLTICAIAFPSLFFPSVSAENSSLYSSQSDIAALDHKIPVEREMAGGQTHSYRVSLNAGQYVRVAVDQKGIDVAMTLFGPDESNLAEIILPNTLQGRKVIIAVTAAAGNHRLEVRSQKKDAAAGKYEVQLLDLREATAEDRTRVAIRKLVAEASNLRLQGTAQSLNLALEKLQQALPLIRSIRDRYGESEALANMGAAYFSLSDYQKTIEMFTLALAIWQETGDRQGQAVAYNYFANSWNVMGEWEKVIESLKKALLIHQAQGDRISEAITLGNISTFYSKLGDMEKGLEYANLALLIRRETGDRGGEASTLNIIGSIHEASGDHRKAIEIYEQALRLRPLADRRIEANLLRNLGTAYAATGDTQSALDYLRQAVLLSRETGGRQGEASALRGLGEVCHSLGQTEKALEYFNESLPIARAIGHREGEARSLHLIARTQRDLDQLQEARLNIEAAISIIESLRSRIGDQQQRSSYFATVGNYYDLYIDILMRQRNERNSENLSARAIEASERARARSLLELLAEARIEIRQGVNAELLKRERMLQQSLNTSAEQQIRLLSGKHTAEQAEAAAKQVASLTTQLQEVRAQIRAANPRYATLTQPEPLSLREIQEQALDQDTLLLEYALGDKRSYVWAVTQTTIRGYELPSHAEIEAAARRFYDLLRGHAEGRGDAETRRRGELEEAGAQLSRMLLAPVAEQLGTKRLVIVADGALQYVPFAALPAPSATASLVTGHLPLAGKDAKGKGLMTKDNPLILEHEIVNLPSASTLAVMRRELKGRASAPKLVAVLADPVFDINDVRLRRAAKEITGSEKTIDNDVNSKLVRSIKETGLANGEWPLPRLLGTRREATAILALAPESKRRRALDFEANRDVVTGSDIGQYQIIHFATHGLLNSRNPELSGIVLSLVDSQGRAQDGFLRLHEIYNLRLSAELVVLSACQTGLGKEIRGEGLIGLTRGFMYAGARRLVTSLWQVDDKATSELMMRFYRGMFERKLTAAAALRAAQIEMWQQKDWQSPYYWASFALQGEWR
jgi:CHAT domain-containing protein/tetratricopeptide (TPR) repeat protein